MGLRAQLRVMDQGWVRKPNAPPRPSNTRGAETLFLTPHSGECTRMPYNINGHTGLKQSVAMLNPLHFRNILTLGCEVLTCGCAKKVFLGSHSNLFSFILIQSAFVYQNSHHHHHHLTLVVFFHGNLKKVKIKNCITNSLFFVEKNCQLFEEKKVFGLRVAAAHS